MANDIVSGASAGAAVGSAINPGVGTAIGAGAGAILGAGYGLITGNASTRKQYTNTRKLMKYQNEINQANWNLVNEYNLPINEKKRLLAAGINPNFAQGTSQAGEIGASSLGQTDKPDYGGVDALAKGVAFGQQIAQTENTQANTELIRTQEEGQQIKNEQDAFQLEQDKKFTPSERTMGLNKSNQDILESVKRVENIAQQINESNQRIANLIRDGHLKEAQEELVKAQTFTENITRLFRVENISADTSVKKEEAKAIPQRTAIAKQNADTASKEAETNRQALSWRQNQDKWQRDYDNRLLSLQATRNYYLNALDEVNTEFVSSKNIGQQLQNGYDAYELDLRSWVAELELDKNEKQLLNDKLRQEGWRLKAEIKEINARKDLTEEQKKTEAVKQTKMRMETIYGAVNTAANATNMLNPFSKKTPPAPTNGYTIDVSN